MLWGVEKRRPIVEEGFKELSERQLPFVSSDSLVGPSPMLSRGKCCGKERAYSESVSNGKGSA